MENMRNCTQCSQHSEQMSRRWPQDNCSDREIGMAYVPWQQMEQLYEPAQALRAGTLFPELEKPFYGCMRRGNQK